MVTVGRRSRWLVGGGVEPRKKIESHAAAARARQKEAEEDETQLRNLIRRQFTYVGGAKPVQLSRRRPWHTRVYFMP
jgi:hypothetical protein